MENSQTITLKNRALAPGLYVVATPIGNLGDITLRALETLHAASVIACEDTRTSGTLLKHYGIHTPTLSFHEHSGADDMERLLGKMETGEAVALISDAGTPLIADPGFALVRAARARHVKVFAVPGASSVTAAMSIAALPGDAFTFIGFLPAKAQARREMLTRWQHHAGIIAAFETPHRLLDSLQDIADLYGTRRIAVAREITKLYEELREGTAAELLAHFTAHEPRGEMVLLIEPAPQEKADVAEIDVLLRKALAQMSVKDAAQEIAAITGMPKKEIYARALTLRGE